MNAKSRTDFTSVRFGEIILQYFENFKFIMIIPSNYIAIRPSFQRPLLIIFTIALVLITAEYSLSVMQRLRRFFLQLHDVLLEFRPTISHNVSDVRLLLWTRKSPMVYQQLIPWDPISLSTSSYNRSKPTKIMIHGFSDRSRYSNTLRALIAVYTRLFIFEVFA